MYVFSTYHDGTQVGESAMIVIDSKTGEYKKIDKKMVYTPIEYRR